MTDYVSYGESLDEETIAFQVKFLVEFLGFLDKQGIHSRPALERVSGRKLLSEPLWKISEANTLNNRKHNLRFYSEGAHSLAYEKNFVPTSRKEHGIEHEHIVPRQLLEDWLFRCRSSAADVARTARFSVGCVITVKEHQALEPNPWGEADPTTDPWRRYRDARVRVYDRKRSKFVDLNRGLPE